MPRVCIRIAVFALTPFVLPTLSVPLSLLFSVGTRLWTDNDSSGFPDVGEVVESTIVVLNTGTVTLRNVEVTDTSGVVICDEMQPVASLHVGGFLKCASSQQVKTQPAPKCRGTTTCRLGMSISLN